MPFFILRNGVSTAGAESSAFHAKPTSSQVHSIPSQTLCQSRHADEDRKHNSFQRPDCMRSQSCCKIVNGLTGGRLRRNIRHGLRLRPLVFGSTLVAEQKQTRPMERLTSWNIWLSRYNRSHDVARRNMAQKIQGTNRRSQHQLELEIENMGGHLNAYTSVGKNCAWVGFSTNIRFSVRILSTTRSPSIPTWERLLISSPIFSRTPSWNPPQSNGNEM